MANITEDRDIDLSPILSRKVAVVGFGSQGHAHALNLRDSGVDVRVALHKGSASRERATGLGFEVWTVADAASWADVVVLAVPDTKAPEVFGQMQVLPGKAVVFLHGFAYHYGFVSVPSEVDVILVSPAGPGPVLRSLFEKGSGFASLYAVAEDASGNAKSIALAYARAVGCAKAGVIESTFKEETETDLFGEQAVLCGGLPELIKAGFDTLVEAGYQPEVAFFECVHQVKLITDLIYEGGLTWMRNSISGTAEWGGFESGPRIIGNASKEAMKAVLEEVQSGEFAKKWMSEFEKGTPELMRRRELEKNLLMEEIGRNLRSRMPFIVDK